MKSLLLFYVNSGLFRFDEYKNYCAKHDGENVDLDKLIIELDDEMFSDDDFYN